MSSLWLATVAALPLASLEDVASPPVASSTPLPADFDAIYTRYFDFVWRNLLRFGVQPSAADDAAHDVFLVVHKQLPRFDGKNPRGWLFAIARRVGWHYRRAHARQRTAPIDEDCFSSDPATCPEEHRQRREASDLVNSLLNQLSDDRRAVFVLAELEQLSMPEIAEMLGIPLNTAYSRLRLARRDFSRCLQRHELKQRRNVP